MHQELKKVGKIVVGAWDILRPLHIRRAPAHYCISHNPVYGQ
jgi:hypothetical protein